MRQAVYAFYIHTHTVCCLRRFVNSYVCLGKFLKSIRDSNIGDIMIKACRCHENVYLLLWRYIYKQMPSWSADSIQPFGKTSRGFQQRLPGRWYKRPGQFQALYFPVRFVEPGIKSHAVLHVPTTLSKNIIFFLSNRKSRRRQTSAWTRLSSLSPGAWYQPWRGRPPWKRKTAWIMANKRMQRWITLSPSAKSCRGRSAWTAWTKRTCRRGCGLGSLAWRC